MRLDIKTYPCKEYSLGRPLTVDLLLCPSSLARDGGCVTHSRKLRLGAFMRPVSIHTAAWRYPGAFPDANFNFAHYKRFAQTLERGRFDAFFMADHLAVLNMPMQASNAARRSRPSTP